MGSAPGAQDAQQQALQGQLEEHGHPQTLGECTRGIRHSTGGLHPFSLWKRGPASTTAPCNGDQDFPAFPAFPLHRAQAWRGRGSRRVEHARPRHTCPHERGVCPLLPARLHPTGCSAPLPGIPQTVWSSQGEGLGRGGTREVQPARSRMGSQGTGKGLQHGEGEGGGTQQHPSCSPGTPPKEQHSVLNPACEHATA